MTDKVSLKDCTSPGSCDLSHAAVVAIHDFHVEITIPVWLWGLWVAPWWGLNVFDPRAPQHVPSHRGVLAMARGMHMWQALMAWWPITQQQQFLDASPWGIQTSLL